MIQLLFLQTAVRKDPECVKVVVRCRPMSRKEVEDNRQRIVEIDKKTGEVHMQLIYIKLRQIDCTNCRLHYGTQKLIKASHRSRSLLTRYLRTLQCKVRLEAPIPNLFVEPNKALWL